MSTITTNAARPAGFSSRVLLAPFRGLAHFFVALAEAAPQMRALSRLSELSDEDLAAKGVTRDGEIRRILGGTSLV